jgi:hypothetical protein
MPFLLAAAHLHAARPLLAQRTCTPNSRPATTCKDLSRLSTTLNVFLPDGRGQTQIHV